MPSLGQSLLPMIVSEHLMSLRHGRLTIKHHAMEPISMDFRSGDLFSSNRTISSPSAKASQKVPNLTTQLSSKLTSTRRSPSRSRQRLKEDTVFPKSSLRMTGAFERSLRFRKSTQGLVLLRSLLRTARVFVSSLPLTTSVPPHLAKTGATPSL